MNQPLHAPHDSGLETVESHSPSQDAGPLPAAVAPDAPAIAPAGERSHREEPRSADHGTVAVLPVARRLATPDTRADASPERTRGCALPVGWTFKGSIDAAGDVVVSGHVEGNVHLASRESRLHVLKAGSVHGQASGGNVTVDGNFVGTIDATGATMEFGAESRVDGEVTYSRLLAHGGDHNLTKLQVAKTTTATS